MNAKESIKFSGEMIRIAAFFHDILWVTPSIVMAYALRYNLTIEPDKIFGDLWVMVPVSILAHSICFWLFGLYRGIWRFASLPDLMRIVNATFVGAAFTIAITMSINRLDGVPRTVLILYPILLAIGLSAPRILYRLIRDRHLAGIAVSGGRALIVGAGTAGELLVRDLLRRREYFPVGFIDDDPRKIGLDMHGVRVLGTREQLGDLIVRERVELVILALPSAPHHVRRDVVNRCQALEVACKTLPSLSELDDGAEVRLRTIEIEDLLGRDPVRLNSQQIENLISGRSVVVTGAGGSIGSELCRQIIRLAPRNLILVDHSEFNLFRISEELRHLKTNTVRNDILLDVRDKSACLRLFLDARPDVVFHAAAYKHVPMVEANAFAGVDVNVFGTKAVADAAIESGVKKYIQVSTDKAVNPTSIMGATKRIAETYCQAQTGTSTKFITTRFGNVLDSAGSVVPTFRNQIRCGGPVTVTHPEVTRYFMTIHEACQLILQAAAMGNGGEIFVLEMGEPVKIIDLARQMVILSGLEPGTDIAIELTGLRPGEKLYEELFYETEEIVDTGHPKIRRASSVQMPIERLYDCLESLRVACDQVNDGKLREALRKVVPTVPLQETGGDGAFNANPKVIRLHAGQTIKPA